MSDRTDAPADDELRRGEYVVVARRYRPQTFDQLVGQATVAQALQNAITTERVGHAYLFSGARGVGKTSTARILAKALNCSQGPSSTPCGECDICQQIAGGDDVDVLEIDGASNRGIDEIRQLRSNVGIRPSRARFKIYIIDEVHMLTKEAFNALLKTLEEPPDHVKFVFCTTEPSKIPITVLSRCQRFDFCPVGTAQIVERLQYIVQQEGASAQTAALQLLARRAAGSMRDSQSLLEQLLAFVEGQITVDDVHAMLGTARDERLRAILQPLIQRDAASALTELDQAIAEGVDPGQLAEQLVGSLRDMMVALVGGSGDLLIYYAPSDLESLREQAESWGLQTLLAAAQILDQAVSRMRQSVHSRILLELALVRIARLEELDDLAGMIAQLQESTASTSSVGGASAAKSSAAAGGRSATAKKKEVTPAAPPARPVHGDPTATDKPDATLPAPSDDEATEWWHAALKLLDDITADFAAHASGVATSGPNRLVVRFPAMYNSSKMYCERLDQREKLERAISQAAGRPLRLEFEMVQGDPPHGAPPPPVAGRQQQKRKVVKHPLVERAVELFDAEVLGVEVPPNGPPPQ
jgi:DNA polymerase-3 subunit gamma/tau